MLNHSSRNRVKILVLLETWEKYDNLKVNIEKQPSNADQRKELIKDIKHKIRPTHIIVEGGIRKSIEKYKNGCPYFDRCSCKVGKKEKHKDRKNNNIFFGKEKLLKPMVKQQLLGRVTHLKRPKTVCFETKKIFFDAVCVMTSISVINGLNFVEDFVSSLKKRESAIGYNLLIIDGSHGSEEVQDAMDNRKDYENVEAYRQTCKMFGLKYSEKYLEADEYQQRDDSTGQDAVINDPYLKDWCFTVVNVNQFKRNQNCLIKWVRNYDPDILAIPWCYSINGTKAKLLAPQFSRIMLGHDQMSMLGGQMKLVELDKQQKEVLDEVESFEKQHAVLTGGILELAEQYSLYILLK